MTTSVIAWHCTMRTPLTTSTDIHHGGQDMSVQVKHDLVLSLAAQTLMDALTIVYRPMNEAVNLMRTTFKTLKGSVDWRPDTSHGAIDKGIIGTWASVRSLVNADGVGFIPGDEAPYVLPAVMAQDAELAEVMLQVTCSLCFSSLTSAMTYSHKLQGVFAFAGNPRPTQSTVALRNMKSFVFFLGQLEDRGREDTGGNTGGWFCSRPRVASYTLRSRGACDVT